MDGKRQILTALAEVFNRCQDLLENLSEVQIIQPLLPSDWSVKDVVAHLWTWQQVSVARMEAALYDREPAYPPWWDKFGPDPEEVVDQANAWNYAANRDKPWKQVVGEWKSQFQRYLELTRKVPEEDVLVLGRFTWMGKYALSASVMGSLEHHEEHLEKLLDWLKEHG